MAKTSGKTSSNPRGRRPAAGGAKRNAPSPLTTLFGGLKDLMKVNFDNRRIPTLIGLVLAACTLFACLALITFLFSGGSDQSLIYAARDGEAAAELGREAKNILGLPGPVSRLPLQPALRLGDRLRALLRRLPLCAPHLAPPYRALPLHHKLPHQWLPLALGLRSSSGPTVALPLG